MLEATTLSQYPVELHRNLKEVDAAWEDLEFAVEHAERTLLFGPAGTGKSRAGSNHARNERPLVRIHITYETSAAEVRGHWLMGPKGATFMHGPGARAWVEGARLVIDEIDQAGGDTIPLLHALLDDNEVAELTLADGSTIKPAPGFTCVATMNSDPVALPPALLDRFVVRRHVPFPKPAILETLPKVIRVAAALALYSANVPERLTGLRSTRVWVEIGRLVTKGLSVKDALSVVGAIHALPQFDGVTA